MSFRVLVAGAILGASAVLGAQYIEGQRDAPPPVREMTSDERLWACAQFPTDACKAYAAMKRQVPTDEETYALQMRQAQMNAAAALAMQPSGPVRVIIDP